GRSSKIRRRSRQTAPPLRGQRHVHHPAVGTATPARLADPQAPRGRTPPCPGRGRATAPAATAQGAARCHFGGVGPAAGLWPDGRLANPSKLKITRKKKVRRAQERGRPDVQQKRQAFCAELADVDPEKLVFVDEMGATTAMARIYGRAPRGERVYGSVPGQWQSRTLIGGLRLGGVLAPWAFAGATDTAGFQTYAEAVLAPALGEGGVVIWDNLK